MTFLFLRTWQKPANQKAAVRPRNLVATRRLHLHLAGRRIVYVQRRGNALLDGRRIAVSDTVVDTLTGTLVITFG